MVSGSTEYVTELFSSFERQISRNSVVVKAGFYENFILKTVIQKSEPKKFKIKKKTENKRDKCVSDDDRTWGLESQ